MSQVTGGFLFAQPPAHLVGRLGLGAECEELEIADIAEVADLVEQTDLPSRCTPESHLALIFVRPDHGDAELLQRQRDEFDERPAPGRLAKPRRRARPDKNDEAPQIDRPPEADPGLALDRARALIVRQIGL
ncbi:MAG: hypothetical protein AAF526_01515 [Pseudomonadota bacterium]